MECIGEREESGGKVSVGLPRAVKDGRREALEEAEGEARGPVRVGVREGVPDGSLERKEDVEGPGVAVPRGLAEKAGLPDEL